MDYSYQSIIKPCDTRKFTKQSPTHLAAPLLHILIWANAQTTAQPIDLVLIMVQWETKLDCIYFIYLLFTNNQLLSYHFLLWSQTIHRYKQYIGEKHMYKILLSFYPLNTLCSIKIVIYVTKPRLTNGGLSISSHSKWLWSCWPLLSAFPLTVKNYR